MTSTPESILRAAAQLFAAHGYRGTSMRRLAAAAGVNVASVHYHFGNKEGLFRELLRRSFEPINEERLSLLDQALQRSGGAPLEVEELVRIFLGPAVRQLPQASTEMPSVLARIHHDPEPGLARMVVELVEPCIERFMAEMSRSVPHLGETNILLRGHFMIGAMLHMLDAGRGPVAALTRHRIDAEDHDLLLDELVAFCAAGYRHA